MSYHPYRSTFCLSRCNTHAITQGPISCHNAHHKGWQNSYNSKVTFQRGFKTTDVRWIPQLEIDVSFQVRRDSIPCQPSIHLPTEKLLQSSGTSGSTSSYLWKRGPSHNRPPRHAIEPLIISRSAGLMPCLAGSGGAIG